MNAFFSAAQKLHDLAQDIVAADWEAALAGMRGVTPVTDSNRNMFIGLLSGRTAEDTYAVSPAYYLFTGRKGLWLYQHERSFLLFCHHPNVEHEILVFPPFGPQAVDALRQFLLTVPLPAGRVKLARVPVPSTLLASLGLGIRSAYRNTHLHAVSETVLDWRYPARVIDVLPLTQLAGKGLRQVRRNVRAVEAEAMHIEPLSFAQDEWLYHHLLQRWMTDDHGAPFQNDNMAGPYVRLFELGRDPELKLRGLKFMIDGSLQGVAIWETFCPGAANFYANFCNTDIAGLSDVMLVESMRRILASGMRYVNLGGSETRDLDAYKCKFGLARSVDLCSIDVRLEETADAGLLKKAA